MPTFLAGQRVTADQLNLATQKIISRGRRISSPAAVTTETGVLRLDDVPVKAGRLYRIYTNSIGLDSTVANDGIRLGLRYTTDGTTPSVSSTALTIAQAVQVNAAHGEYVVVDAVYTPAADEQLSVLLTVSRSAGSGSVQPTASTGVPGPIDLYIEDMGEDVGDTGTDI